MRRLLPLSLLLSLLLAVCSCDDYRLLDAEPRLVVEGWINAGEFPVVFVTTTIPLTQETQTVDSLANHVLTWSKVTISDGERTVTMVGRVNSKFFLRNYFTTSWMRGEAGKTYTIEVSYKDYHATATATIPLQPACVDSFSVCRDAAVDTLYDIRAHVSPQAGGTGYYKFMVAEGERSQNFLSSYMGLYTEANIADGATFRVCRPHLLNENPFRPNFRAGEVVRVRFAALDEQAYRYWDAFEQVASLAVNPLFPANINLPGNVQGAYGYWHGYNATDYLLRLPQE